MHPQRYTHGLHISLQDPLATLQAFVDNFPQRYGTFHKKQKRVDVRHVYESAGAQSSLLCVRPNCIVSLLILNALRFDCQSETKLRQTLTEC
jgi:hypothetical protein